MNRFGKIFTILAVVLSSASAHAIAEVYFGTHPGNTHGEEFNTGTKYDHTSEFMDFGLSLGTRLKIPLGKFKLGVVAEYAWVGQTILRKDINTNIASGYRNEKHRLLAGAALSVEVSKTYAIDLEYYPYYSNNVFFSDEKSINPNRKGDKQTGIGGAIGFSRTEDWYTVTLLYRELRVDKDDLGGYSAPLPEFTPIRTQEVAATMGINF
jgi:hypothetical protein